MVGIILDKWHPNANNGRVKGVQYFAAPPGRGYFAKKSLIVEKLGDTPVHGDSVDISAKEPLPKNDLKIGDRVQVRRGKTGVVKFIGETEFTEGEVIGLELDESTPAGHDGTVRGKKYFEAQNGRGYFTRRSSIRHVVTPLVDRLKDYVFMTRSRDDESKEYRFEDVSEFQIPCKSLFDSMDAPRSVDLYIKPNDESWNFIRIASLMKSRYLIERDSPLRINQSIVIPPADRMHGKSGSLMIQCTSDIVIAPKVTIKGSDNMLNAKGSSLILMSNGNVTNEGTLCCSALGDGDDGDMYILSDSFMNDGEMKSDRGGRIFVFCREFKNNGRIAPVPVVIINSMDGDNEENLLLPLKVAVKCECDRIVLDQNRNVILKEEMEFRERARTLEDRLLSRVPISVLIQRGILDDGKLAASLPSAASILNQPLTRRSSVTERKTRKELVQRDTGFKVGDEIVDLLIESGAFHIAVKYGQSEVIKMLYEHLVKVKRPKEVNDLMNSGYGGNGCTPLHFACMGGYEDIARYLIDTVKVDILRKDNDNKMGMDYAVENGHQSITEWMSQLKKDRESEQNKSQEATGRGHRKAKSSRSIELDAMTDHFWDAARIQGPLHYRKFSVGTKESLEDAHVADIGMIPLIDTMDNNIDNGHARTNTMNSNSSAYRTFMAVD